MSDDSISHPINHMTNNTIVKNLEEIMKDLNNTINLCKDSQADTVVSSDAIQAMVLFRKWRHDQDGWEHVIEEEMISFFPSIEKATNVANQWVERGRKKESPDNFHRFTAFVIPIDKKLNGRRLVNNHVNGFESEFEVGDHF